MRWKLTLFDEETLTFHRIKKRWYLVGLLTFLVILIGCCQLLRTEEFIQLESHIEIRKESEEFSSELFYQYLLDLNLKFPEIVMAQAILESGNFSSKLWELNSNPFGMKLARLRPTTSISSSNSYANYLNWRSAALDYALWQAAYAKSTKTEDDYYELLGVYAEDPNYQKKLIPIINNLKSKK